MELLNSLDSQFVGFICERHGLHKKNIESFLDGHLITAADALEIGLIDEFGGSEAACAQLIPGFPLLTEYEDGVHVLRRTKIEFAPAAVTNGDFKNFS